MSPKNRLAEMFAMNNWFCRRYQPLLIPYAEDTLDAMRRAQVDGHLSACPACRIEVETLREMNHLLTTSAAVPTRKSFNPSSDLWSRIEAQIVPPVVQPSPAALSANWGQMLRIGVPVCAAAMVLAVIASHNPHPDRTINRGAQNTASVPSLLPRVDAAPDAASSPEIETSSRFMKTAATRRRVSHKPLAVLAAVQANTPRPDPFAPMGQNGQPLSHSFAIKHSPAAHTAAVAHTPLETKVDDITPAATPVTGMMAYSSSPSGSATPPRYRFEDNGAATAGPILDGVMVRGAAVPRARVVQVAFEPATELRPLTNWESPEAKSQLVSMALRTNGGDSSRVPQVKHRGNMAIARASFSSFPGVTPPVDTLVNRVVPASEVSDVANGARRRRELFSFGSR